MTFLSWSCLYHPCIYCELVLAIRFSLNARLITRIRDSIVNSKCLTSGCIALVVGVAGPCGCSLSTKLNNGSVVARCTCVLYA